MGGGRRRRRKGFRMFTTPITPRTWDLVGYAILAAGVIVALIQHTSR